MIQTHTSRVFDHMQVSMGTLTIGPKLLELGYLTPEELEEAFDYQRRHGGWMGGILATRGHVSREHLYEALSAQLRLPFVPDTQYILNIIDKNTALCLSRNEMVKYQIIPLRRQPGILTILTADPNKKTMLDFLRKRFGDLEVKQIVVTDREISRLSAELFRRPILKKSQEGMADRAPANLLPEHSPG